MREIESFEPLDTEETMYPFNIEENVCGMDRVGRVLGAVTLFLVSFNLVRRRRLGAAAVMLAAAGGLVLNAATKRCMVSEVLGVNTCDEE